ncbi:MAG: flap endonuclease-1 [Halobacteriota archaeon]|nr:flap endonuclease-1 [Halobacteriota archaeon]
MGVDLGGLFERQNLEFSSLSGRIVAIDTNNMLYQFLSTIRQSDGTPLLNSSGEVTSHLSGLIYRLINLVEAGIKPVFVFDGKPPELKGATLQQRRVVKEKAMKRWDEAKATGSGDAFKYAQSTSRVTEDITRSTKRLLSYMGMPMVQSPSDGEAQASFMSLKGDVDYVGSQDYDSLLFGSEMLLRNLTVTGKRKLPGKNVYVDVRPELINLKTGLSKLGITREQLVDMAILMGTDFNKGIKGIGPKRALKLIKKHGSIEWVLSELDTSLDLFPEVRTIFLHPDVSNDYDLKWKTPDESNILEFLCDENGFSEDRIQKAVFRLRDATDAQGQMTLNKWF